MNVQSLRIPRADASAKNLPGHTADSELAHNMRALGRTSIFKRGSRESADGSRAWRLWRSRSEALSAENRRNVEFMAVLSHELRNSLGAVSSAAACLPSADRAAPAVSKARVMIERQVTQMSRLVEDLLDVSRIRTGQLRLQRERIDLCAVAAHSVHAVEFSLQQRNQRLTTSFPAEPMWLEADAVRLQQVFVNLLSNAAKYTDAGGAVSLAVSREEGEAVVRIHDSGVGIAPDFLPSVFDLFVQADATSPRTEGGLGIGLALVRNLVECHGGRVTAASDGVGQGSEFTVRLPLARGA